MRKYPQYSGNGLVGALQIASISPLGVNKARFTLEGSPMHAEELSVDDHPGLKDARVGYYLIHHKTGEFSALAPDKFEAVYTKVAPEPSVDTPLRPSERQEQDMKMRDIANKATTLPNRGDDLPAEGLPAERDIVTHKVPDTADVKLPKSDSTGPDKEDQKNAERAAVARTLAAEGTTTHRGDPANWESSLEEKAAIKAGDPLAGKWPDDAGNTDAELAKGEAKPEHHGKHTKGHK